MREFDVNGKICHENRNLKKIVIFFDDFEIPYDDFEVPYFHAVTTHHQFSGPNSGNIICIFDVLPKFCN